MAEKSISKIVLLSNGLAGALCAAKLQAVLPQHIELIYIESASKSDHDILFGTVTSPSVYNFLLSLGVTEPELFLRTNSSFSLGTAYKDWGENRRSWLQCFFESLPVFQGVEFHHYLSRIRNTSPELADLQNYIMSAQAGNAGVFAHPPADRKTPLSDMRYGYHFSPEEWYELLTEKLDSKNLTLITSDIASIDRQGGKIRSLTLSDGMTVEADFFIDAFGPESKLSLIRKTSDKCRYMAASSFFDLETGNDLCRGLTQTSYGWQANTPLRARTHQLTFFESKFKTEALKDHKASDPKILEFEFGGQETPWSENCLSIGLAANIVSPLTPAPMMLLERDIERLAELIPLSTDMSFESREYNRRYQGDRASAQLFEEALANGNTEHSPKLLPRLTQKIEQFESRGTLVQYDYEVFSQEDWTILHWGMGRYPARYSPLIENVTPEQIRYRLNDIRQSIDMVVEKLPPHKLYLRNFMTYLRKNYE